METPTTSYAQSSYEIHTRTSVYLLDASYRCVDVQDAKTRTSWSVHPCLGGQLIGGRLIASNGQVLVTAPLPAPGYQALFQRSGKGRADGPVALSGQVMRVCLRTHRANQDGTGEVIELGRLVEHVYCFTDTDLERTG